MLSQRLQFCWLAGKCRHKRMREGRRSAVTWEGLYSFPRAARTDDPKLAGLRPHTFIFSHWWQWEFWNQGVGTLASCCRLCWRPGARHSPSFWSLLEIIGCPWLLDPLLWALPLFSHGLVLFSVVRTLAIGFKTQLGNPGWSHRKSAQLNYVCQDSLSK